MTTNDVLGARDRRTSVSGRLQARLWIGRNPGMFVAACAAFGFLLGAATGERS